MCVCMCVCVCVCVYVYIEAPADLPCFLLFVQVIIPRFISKNELKVQLPNRSYLNRAMGLYATVASDGSTGKLVYFMKIKGLDLDEVFRIPLGWCVSSLALEPCLEAELWLFDPQNKKAQAHFLQTYYSKVVPDYIEYCQTIAILKDARLGLPCSSLPEIPTGVVCQTWPLGSVKVRIRCCVVYIQEQWCCDGVNIT